MEHFLPNQLISLTYNLGATTTDHFFRREVIRVFLWTLCSGKRGRYNLHMTERKVDISHYIKVFGSDPFERIQKHRPSNNHLWSKRINDLSSYPLRITMYLFSTTVPLYLDRGIYINVHLLLQTNFHIGQTKIIVKVLPVLESPMEDHPSSLLNTDSQFLWIEFLKSSFIT